MPKITNLTDRIAIGEQPSIEDLDELSKNGYRAVVNLRDSGEQGGISPEEEGIKVREFGMLYSHVPVTLQTLNDDLMARFREEIVAMPGPVFVHCAAGKRAAAIALMHVATVKGMTGDEALQEAARMGFELDNPKFAEFVKRYVDEHHARLK